jgi:hypothetical protein
MRDGVLADTIGATWASWTSAAKVGDRAAMHAAAEHSLWLAAQAVTLVERDGPSSFARRLLGDALDPVANAIEDVGELLRRARWR